MTENLSTKETPRVFLSTRDMALVSLFAMLTAVGAMIKIPIPFSPLPMTLQTAMVFFAGAFLGARRASLAMTMYMIMGLIGIPVFTQGGGFHNVLVPSFGFIVGFIPAAFIIGRICEVTGQIGRENAVRSGKGFAIAASRAFACFSGYLAYNVIGVLWMHMNINYLMGKSMTLRQSLMIAFVPFVVPDMLKLGAVVLLLSLIHSRIKEPERFSSK